MVYVLVMFQVTHYRFFFLAVLLQCRACGKNFELGEWFVFRSLVMESTRCLEKYSTSLLWKI